MIIGLTGAAMSGKDTVGAYLQKTHAFAPTAFADPIRTMLIAGLDLEPYHFRPENKESVIAQLNCSPRRLMQTLGTDWGRHIVADSLWTDIMARRLRAADHLGEDVVITDVRFLSEADLVKRLGGEVWRVIRPGAATTEHSAHRSEREQSDISVDRSLINNGTLEQLYEQIDAALGFVFEIAGETTL